MRIHCDKKIEELKRIVDDVEDEFNDYLEEITDEIDSLVIEIREERLIDIKEIETELINIRDRMLEH